MRRLIVTAAVLVLAACGPPAFAPPPAPPNPFGVVLREIFHSSVPDPTGVHAPREPHSCAIKLAVPATSLHDYYEPVDPEFHINGWEFWTACVIPSRDLGYTLPVVKIGGVSDDQPPLLTFHFDTAPVLGLGTGHYDNPQAANRAVWARAKIETVQP